VLTVLFNFGVTGGINLEARRPKKFVAAAVF